MRLARTASVLLAGVTLGTVTLAGVLASGATAAAAARVGLNPAVGSPGSAFTITFSGFVRECGAISLRWEGTTLATVPWTPDGAVDVAVPDDASGGPHDVSAASQCEKAPERPFFVLARPTFTPTTDPPPPPTTDPTTTQPTTTTRPTTTTTTATTTTETTTSPPTSQTTTTTDRPDKLSFDKPAVQAGEPLSASGAGCTPGGRVSLASGGEVVGGANAGPDGRFTTAVEFRHLQPGRREVVAECGVVLTGTVDLILTSSTRGNTSTLAVLVFFLLAGVTVVARPRPSR